MWTKNTNKCLIVTATNLHRKLNTPAPIPKTTKPLTDNNTTVIKWAPSNRAMGIREIKHIRETMEIRDSMEIRDNMDSRGIRDTMDNRGIKDSMELRGVWHKLEKV
jgi:hypothetical protein